MMPAAQFATVVHFFPSSPYDVPGHTVHLPLATLLPRAHLVHDAVACPAVPSVQFVIAVHFNPSVPYDVPGHGEHALSDSWFPGRHLVHVVPPLQTLHALHHD